MRSHERRFYLACLALLAAIAALIGWRNAGAPGFMDEIRTKRLVLVDDSGAVRGELAVVENGARWRLLDRAGVARVEIGIHDKQAQIVLWDEARQGSTMITSGGPGAPSIAVRDAKGTTRAALSLLPDGSVSFGLGDAQRTRAIMTSPAAGPGSFGLMDAQGATLAALHATEATGAMSLRRPADDSSVRFACQSGVAFGRLVDNTARKQLVLGTDAVTISDARRPDPTGAPAYVERVRIGCQADGSAMLTLRDGSGAQRCALASLAGVKGAPYLALLDAGERVRGEMTVERDHMRITMRDEQSKPRLVSEVTPAGDVRILQMDDTQQMHAEFSIVNERPRLLLRDSHGRLRTFLGVNDVDAPEIRLLDADGRIQWCAP